MRIARFLSIFLCFAMLTGCPLAPPGAHAAPSPHTPLNTLTPVPVKQIPEPSHSPLYIPGVEVDDVITYFSEVCLDAEFSQGGNPSIVQKWTIPIRYMVFGQPTKQDLAILEEYTAWLNTIEGFPGISETEDPSLANLRIHFCTNQELLDIMGEEYVGLDGAVTFWYRNNEIYDAVICCRKDLNQHLRNSVILEEIYNGLGPVQDTSLRPDSIIYAEFSEPQALTEMDKLILRLLYHPQILCGMDAEDCAEIICQLYW